MFDKIMEAQQKAGEVKKRLDAITVTGTAEGGKITVNANANKVIQSINIDENFFVDADKEELEELLLIAINKAMEQAENISQSEMAAMTQQMFGGLGGLFGKQPLRSFRRGMRRNDKAIPNKSKSLVIKFLFRKTYTTASYFYHKHIKHYENHLLRSILCSNRSRRQNTII